MENLNPNFDPIGQQFLQYFYQIFDSLAFKTDANAKAMLTSLYHTDAMLTFEGSQIQGSGNIINKFVSLPFKKLQRNITTVDCQPVAQGAVMVMVVGQIQTDDDKLNPFSHTFLLRPNAAGEGWIICHEIFRLSLHNF